MFDVYKRAVFELIFRSNLSMCLRQGLTCVSIGKTLLENNVDQVHFS